MKLLAYLLLLAIPLSARAELSAGAHAEDITPPKLPVIVNGGFLEKMGTAIHDRLHARALVLDDGKTRVAFCVVDTCMIPRELIDAAKEESSRVTGIPAERMLVSATHTHSAPSAMGCLGTRLDADYADYLRGRIAAAIIEANTKRRPARAGWTVVEAWEYTHCRRWIRRPDKMLADPFGEISARANMHPGYESPDVTGPAGPIDPDLTLFSVQTREGRPLAVLANFSMHYFGAPALSADHCGRFASGLGKLIGAAEDSGFVGILSQGTSGDLHWMDYNQPKKDRTLDEYAAGLLRLAADACARIEHRSDVPLAMAEAKLKVRRRVPDAARLAWARGVVAQMGDRRPKDRSEVYAAEQLFLTTEPERELKLQALSIGGLGLTALPNEVFAITGLKLKAQSPLRPTMNIELANGADGYIPPPEQHHLGGYTTWAARTAGLEVEAEPRIVETVLGLLEKVSGEKRRPLADSHGPYAQAVLASRPLSYWRLDEIQPPMARDATGHGHHAQYENGIAMYLPGAQARADAISAIPERPSTFSGPQINRAPHLAGGRLRAELPTLGRTYSVELWFWNALPGSVRPVAGHLFSRGTAGDPSAAGEHLGLGGSASPNLTNRLFFSTGTTGPQALAGRTAITLRTWHHLVFVRDGAKVRVHLDGQATPEIEGEADWTVRDNTPSIFLGGRCDGFANFEGRLDEVALYDRTLTPEEIAAHFRASGRPAAP